MTIASQPANNEKEISPFHIFDRRDFAAYTCNNPENRFYNSYYMISLLTGSNCLEYAHQTIFTNHVLVFATPLTPCKCTPLHIGQQGYLCLLTEDFMLQSKIGLAMDHLPIFRPGGFPVFELSEQEAAEITGLFKKMQLEMNSSYQYKYDLISNMVMEIIHYGQKRQPTPTINHPHDSASLISALFAELLESQFPITSTQQKLKLRSAKDYAACFSIHINHLNKLLKDATGKTTTEHILNRLTQEAKILLRKTNWNISEIAYCLGFEQASNFSAFFKKQTKLSPVAMRNQLI